MADLEPKPLYVSPWPLGNADRELLRAAKIAMNVPWKVFFAQPPVNKWVRVLALREAPSLINEHALVPNPQNQQALMAAINWAVTGDKDNRATTVDKFLSKLFGQEVREARADKVAYDNISKRLDLADMRVPSWKRREKGEDINE